MPGPSETGFIAIRDAVKSFGAVRALDGVSLGFAPGQIRCLAGENGCGKSTLIKVLSGVLRPDAGRITIDGVPYQRLRPLQAIRLGIQVIYQDFALFPNLSVAENLALPGLIEARRFQLRPAALRPAAEAALARLGVRLDPERRVGELSVAHQQLVAIARALRQQARLLILDEPTTALTHHEVQSLFATLRDLRCQGVSVLLVTHKTREVLAIADAITVMRNGRIVAQGSGADFDADALASALTGSEVGRTLPAPAPIPAPAAEPRLETGGLCSGAAVRDASLRLAPGEILGLAGLLGAGRTALASALFGLRRIDSGEVRIDGAPVAIEAPGDAIQAGLAYVPEDRLSEGLFLPRSIEHNLAVASLSARRPRRATLDRRGMRRLADDAVAAFGIRTPSVLPPVHTLSGGNQQKVLLARWLATDARVLILNRPTAGVDIGAREDIHARMRRLAAGGLSVLLISDELPELVALAHRVAVMHRGRIAGELAGDAVTEAALAAWLDRLA
ncbi:MAG: sugar ABC transporter ATP-binding protein [Verrucomicrobiales bacterium]|nr:sugar ABC transporter ATP-binding protein [Verrucomicrobiales bacterium]MCP5525199.1 sugar ABC transporter ATP-binding protein [Verrucomicrobiales bacterium]